MNFKYFLESELTDNTIYHFTFQELENSYSYTANGRNINQKIEFSHKSEKLNIELRMLSKELEKILKNKNFIDDNVYYFNINEYEHNTSDTFYEYKDSIDSKRFLNDAELSTGNLVGFVKRKNFSVNISSRFGNLFLECLIADTDGFLELENYGDVESHGLMEWLLIILWKSKLRKAYRLGLPKEYVSKKDYLSRIRGNFDINEFLLNRQLFPPFKCSYREHSYDNPLTQIVNFAFKAIRNKSLIEDCNRIHHDFIFATSDKKYSVKSLIKYKGVRNPFYIDYNDVLKLSKLLIKNDTLDTGVNDNEYSAFFFDVSMLFEHFIRKLLIRSGYNLEEKNLSKYYISRGKGNAELRSLKPDIIIFNQDDTIDLFDVKYKHFDSEAGVNREDLFELHTYLGNALSKYANVNRCGFIYPIRNSQLGEKKCILENEIVIAEKHVKFEVRFFVVPDEEIEGAKLNRKEYINSFQKSLDQFINNFKN